MWTQEKTLELIDVIQCRPFLYDTEAKNYRNKKIVDNTWSDVDFAMKTPRKLFYFSIFFYFKQ